MGPLGVVCHVQPRVPAHDRADRVRGIPAGQTRDGTGTGVVAGGIALRLEPCAGDSRRGAFQPGGRRATPHFSARTPACRRASAAARCRSAWRGRLLGCDNRRLLRHFLRHPCGAICAARRVGSDCNASPCARAQQAVPWTLDVLLFCVGGLVLSMVISGGWQFTIRGMVAGVRSVYPFAGARAHGRSPGLRAAWAPGGEPCFRWTERCSCSCARASVLSAPWLPHCCSHRCSTLSASGSPTAGGTRNGCTGAAVPWVSTSPHTCCRTRTIRSCLTPFRQWLTPRPDASFDNVASLTFVEPPDNPRWPGGQDGGFHPYGQAWRLRLAPLALGPFVHVAGMNTHVPVRAFLRYLPVIGLARTPGRFSVVLMLAVAILFAAALCWLGGGGRGTVRRLVAMVGVSARLRAAACTAPACIQQPSPAVYRHVAAAPEDVRVLELPWGIRDGAVSVGNFTARSQFFQTAHGKKLIGGYLSRVSKRRIRDTRRDPMMDALILAQ